MFPLLGIVSPMRNHFVGKKVPTTDVVLVDEAGYALTGSRSARGFGISALIVLRLRTLVCECNLWS